MNLTYKYRIYPTKHQETILNSQLESCRFLFNKILEIRKNTWENEKKSLNVYNTQNLIPKLKITYPFLKNVYSQVLQNVNVRVDLAFQAFFRRLKLGQTPGFPRFKGKNRYNSICYPQYGNGCKLLENNKLHISKIGDVYVEMERPITGNPKTIIISKTSTNKWFISISCIDAIKEYKYNITNKTCGIDVGILSFATFDDGSKINNPRFFESDQKELAKKQKKIVKNKPNKKLKKTIAKIHERIKNRRHEFAHKTANKILNGYDNICIEDININKMIKNSWCNKQINDVAWGMFTNILDYKAEYADKKVVKINPAYTSQTCSSCGTRTIMELKDRVFDCSCGLKLDRDHNAAINILRLGIQSLEKS